jgi:hypothetical protein
VIGWESGTFLPSKIAKLTQKLKIRDKLPVTQIAQMIAAKEAGFGRCKNSGVKWLIRSI